MFVSFSLTFAMQDSRWHYYTLRCWQVEQRLQKVLTPTKILNMEVLQVYSVLLYYLKLHSSPRCMALMARMVQSVFVSPAAPSSPP